MKGTLLSEDLITFSTRLLLARQRGEIVHLAKEMNEIVEKAMKIEKNDDFGYRSEEQEAISATIKFTKKEIDNILHITPLLLSHSKGLNVNRAQP